MERFVVVVRSGQKVVRTNSRQVAEDYAARFNGEVEETDGQVE